MGATKPALERLSPLDVSNLRVEMHGLPMNVAALAILEGAPLLDASGELALEAIRARIEHRLRRAPRLRQKLYAPGFGFGPPVWVDDDPRHQTAAVGGVGFDGHAVRPDAPRTRWRSRNRWASG